MPFPVDIKYVKETERKLGVTFPPGFVVKMAKQNGGGVRTKSDYWWLFPFFDTSDRKRLSRTCNDIVRETQSARERPGFPSEAVAIGTNGGGDLLVLLPHKECPNALG